MIITEEISPLILIRYVQNAYANRFMLLLPINFSMYNTESVMLHTIIYIYMYVFHCIINSIEIVLLNYFNGCLENTLL